MKSMFLLENGTRDSQSNPPFERWLYFYMTITRNFERFQYFNFETNFLKNKNLVQKTGKPLFLLKALRLKTQHFHTKLSCQTNRTRTTKWTFHKERRFASNCFFKIFCFSLRTFHLMYQLPNCPCSYFS